MAKILIEMELEKCFDGCPYCKAERMYTSDSWEHAYNYFCEKKKNKMIAGYVEWDREMPLVPDWCPFKLKEDK